MPDTQFLYFAPSIMPEPQLASFRYIVDQANGDNGNIVFMAHLGDLTEDGLATEFGPVGEVFDYLDQRGAAYSVLAGNHDVNSGTTDQRGSTPYLTTMGPQRFAKSKTFVGADSTGYNTAHVFQGGGRQWLLLALDWRLSPEGFAWANGIIKQYPKLPVILTTHEVAGPTYDDSVYPYQSGDDEDNASLSAYGQQLWDGLINDNDQIFLTLNGHYWPPGRTVLTNAAGNDVHVHITNYQNRYFGGAAMIRLYHFDLELNTIEVETSRRTSSSSPPRSATCWPLSWPSSPRRSTGSRSRSTSPSGSPGSTPSRSARPGRPRKCSSPGRWRTGGSTRAARTARRSPAPRPCPTCPATATT